MRALTSAETSALQARHRSTSSRVLAEDATGTFRDLSTYSGRNWIHGVDWGGNVDDACASATVTLQREIYGISISTLADDSPLNADGPLIDVGREIAVETSTGPSGSARGALGWRRVFRGEVDAPDLAAGADLTLACRDGGGVLLDTQIEEERQYGTTEGVALHLVMQQLLDDVLGEGVVTLAVPSAPTFLVTPYTQATGSLLQALQDLAALIGWVVRYRWSETAGDFALTLYEPERTKTVADWVVTRKQLLKVNRLGLSRDAIRNAIRLEYTDSATGNLAFVFVKDDASIAKYGRRFMRLVETASPIDTEAEALAMANAALADLSAPPAEFEAELLYFWPVEVGDVLTIQAKPGVWDRDQTLAVVAVRNSLVRGKRRTVVTLRGTPAGAYRVWLRREVQLSGQNAQEAPILAQWASDDQGSDASDVFNPAVHLYWRWSLDGGVTWTDWVPFIGQDGASSEGRYTDWRWRVAESQPATPTGTAPEGWFANPPAYDPNTGARLWISLVQRDGATGELLGPWSVPRQLTGGVGPAGAGALHAELTNDRHTIPTAADGSGGVYEGAETTLIVFAGGEDDSANWGVTATPSAGVTGSLSGRTYTVTDLEADSGYVDLVATRSGYPTLTARFSLSKARAGADGTPGTPATAYQILTGAVALKRSITGAYTPSSLSISARSITGAGGPASYSGRFVIAETVDGATYTTKYTSPANESSKVYTPSAGIKGLRIRLYKAGTTTGTPLDEEIVGVVEDGPVGPPGSGDPHAFLRRTGPHAAPPGDDLELSGTLGAGGTGPLQWQMVAVVGGATSEVDWPATWNNTALPATIFAFAAHKASTTIYARVRDAGGRVSTPATWIVDPILESIDSGTGRINPSIPFYGQLRTPNDTDSDAQAGRSADDDLGALHTGAYIDRNAGKVLGVARGGAKLTGSQLMAESDNLTRLTGRNLDNIESTTTRRWVGSGYADTSGRAIALWDTETGVLRDGGYLGGAASRARAAINSSNRVSTGVEATADLGGTPVATVRDQATSPSQNLLGPGAGDEHTLGGGGGLLFDQTFNLHSAGLGDGDTFSIGMFCQTLGSNAARIRLGVQYQFSTGGVIQTDTYDFTGASAYPRKVQEGLSVVPSAVLLRVYVQDLDGVTATKAKLIMLNRGPVSLPYEAPPFRPGRETADHVDPGTIRRVPTHAEADQIAKPGQNLWNSLAGRERVWSSTAEPLDQYSQTSLADMGLEVGQVISFSAELKEQTSSTSTPRFRVYFLNSSGGTIDTTYDSGISGADWAMKTVEGLTIPAGTTSIAMRGIDGQSISGNIRRRMVALGSVALAFAEPSFRVGVDTADVVRDGTSKRVTTHGEANGGGKADGTLLAERQLHPTTVIEALNISRGIKKGSAADLDTVTFPAPLFPTTPHVIFSPGGLTYYHVWSGVDHGPVVEALNVDASGFEMRAILRQAVGTISPKSIGFSGATATKTQTPEAWDDKYTFHFTVNLEPGQVNPQDLQGPRIPSTITLYFYTNDGGGPQLRATRTYSNDGFGPVSIPDVVEVTVNLMGPGDTFQILVASTSGDGGSVTRTSVTWGEASAPAVHSMGSATVPFTAITGT